MFLLLNFMAGLFIAGQTKSISNWLDECPDPSGMVIVLCLLCWPILLWRVWYVSFRQGRE